MTIEHTGFLSLASNYHEDDILHLSEEPLSQTLSYLHDQQAVVRYYISDVEVSLEKAERLFVESLFGKLDSEYYIHYSDITGYLWTTEELQVGGHNLLSELKSHEGKYLILLIDTLDEEEVKERIEDMKTFEHHLKELDKIANKLGEKRNKLIEQIDYRFPY